MTTDSPSVPSWTHEPRAWGWSDGLALAAWTAALAVFFWDAVSLRGALFYFDITEINYAYRDFFAEELRAGRFSRWFPGLYCGMPLFSESQAGYLHPLKYVLYPWLPTWAALNWDTVLSIWLTGVGAYVWLRRHVGPSGALTGAGLFGLSGFVWAHLIHTSMTNALASVPWVVWALEKAWDSGRARWIALGALAMAVQVFAGHLQDAILTAGIVGLYGLYRAAIETGRGPRLFAFGSAVVLVALAVMLSAVQWVPSKELLDRSPRAGGLTWEDLTYGSWHPELLPTLVVREAYGTRARDTDWMDGFYPYHEMNAYMGLIGMALALVGAAAYRDRWVGFWVLLALAGSLLMLGKFTFLFDPMHRIPIVGSSRIPVRYHLWVSLAVAALAAVGVDRLSRAGPVRLRAALLAIGAMVLATIPILLYMYEPVWSEPGRWTTPYHRARYRWLGEELVWASLRTVAVVALGGLVMGAAVRARSFANRQRLAAALPVLVIVDLLGAHAHDGPTVDPAYWTDPPESAKRLRDDPTFIRLYSVPEKSAGEPGYASTEVDFLPVRDTLGWSLPPVWGLASSIGETPIVPVRRMRFTEATRGNWARFDIESVSHIVTGRPLQLGLDTFERAGTALIYRNPHVQPRVRLMGRPVYVDDERAAARALIELGYDSRDRLIVEDPDRPLSPGAEVSDQGRAWIVSEIPERVEVEVASPSPSYLVLADTFDPGWTAALDGRPVPIRPAYAAFRAVFVPEGTHRVVFSYRPAGFPTGLVVSLIGSLLALGMLVWPSKLGALGSPHGDLGWPRRWAWWALGLAVAIVAVSAVRIGDNGRPAPHPRWTNSVHRFTWGAGIEAMRPPPPPLD